jgi:hypothetical protein
MLAGDPSRAHRTPPCTGAKRRSSPAGQRGNNDSMTERPEPERTDEPPENRPDEPGAEGGADSPAADTLPGAPADDESALGDTDQHSDA